ncbi:MAG: zf-TFIIB domain-containing protein [Candidatus Eisenbacteria sp.]|nr:zf-TFIIB domain-containing protein [Candidatus Eisenbacteria bacterium]
MRSLEAELAATRREASALAAQSRPERPDSEPAVPRASAESAASSEGAPYPGASQKLEEEPPYEKYDEEEDFSDSLAGLEQRRRELDRERADRELELGHEPFWMVCPKCGEHLGDHEFDNIKTERCDSCAGLWIDKGEIELLLLFSEEDRVLAYRARGLLQ